jgi:hypothetical protein
MLLTDSTAVARQVLTPIRPKSSTRKTACLDLTGGTQPLQGTGKHVVKSDQAQPVAYRLGTSSKMGRRLVFGAPANAKKKVRFQQNSNAPCTTLLVGPAVQV